MFDNLQFCSNLICLGHQRVLLKCRFFLSKYRVIQDSAFLKGSHTLLLPLFMLLILSASSTGPFRDDACMYIKWLQSWLTLCDHKDCSPPGSSGGDSPGKKTGVFLTQGSNPRLFMSLALAGGFFTTRAT